ncbi:MAG: hypothetical protein M5U09_12990 [Gammaproteobacteria bacterium]|nr:hypothetical protein [Gammaproteobacteria bacterium]
MPRVAGHHRHPACLDFREEPAGVDAVDSGVEMAVVGDDARLGAAQRHRVAALASEFHADQRARYVFARAEQSVQLAARRIARDVAGEIHERLRRLAHGRYHHDQGLAATAALGNLPGHAANVIGRGE